MEETNEKRGLLDFWIPVGIIILGIVGTLIFVLTDYNKFSYKNTKDCEFPNYVCPPTNFNNAQMKQIENGDYTLIKEIFKESCQKRC